MGKKATPTVNPFARALAETEKAYGGKNHAADENQNLFGEALAKTGGKIPQEANNQDLIKQQEELQKEQKKAELRKKLHDQVNPVDQAEIFNANKQRTQKELEEVRRELKNLASEIKKFYKEVDIQTTKQ